MEGAGYLKHIYGFKKILKFRAWYLCSSRVLRVGRGAVAVLFLQRWMWLSA